MEENNNLIVQVPVETMTNKQIDIISIIKVPASPALYSPTINLPIKSKKLLTKQGMYNNILVNKLKNAFFFALPEGSFTFIVL